MAFLNVGGVMYCAIGFVPSGLIPMESMPAPRTLLQPIGKLFFFLIESCQKFKPLTKSSKLIFFYFEIFLFSIY
jgi:hypothetical protein